MTQGPENVWRKCSSCKSSISLGAKYFVCSVSTCNGQRTGYVFCSVACFERHLPGARHKDAGAIEKQAPTKVDTLAPNRVFATNVATNVANQSTMQNANQTASHSSLKSSASAPKEVLVVASRLKDYIHAKSEFNTSASVLDYLSDHLRVVCDRAIENAKADGRKTVMDRDFQFLKK